MRSRAPRSCSRLTTAPWHWASSRFSAASSSMCWETARKRAAAVAEGPCARGRSLVASLIGLDYPEAALQLIVVDDGSEDATGALLASLARRESRLTSVTRPRGATGGKAAALNAALPLVTAAGLTAFLLFTYVDRPGDPSLWIAWSAPRVFSPLTVLFALAAACARDEPEAGARETPRPPSR